MAVYWRSQLQSLNPLPPDLMALTWPYHQNLFHISISVTLYIYWQITCELSGFARILHYDPSKKWTERKLKVTCVTIVTGSLKMRKKLLDVKRKIHNVHIEVKAKHLMFFIICTAIFRHPVSMTTLFPWQPFFHDISYKTNYLLFYLVLARTHRIHQ